MFDATVPRNYPELEKQILKFWEESDIFKKLVQQNEQGTPWGFLDGPVTANNKLGIHHAWGRTYKDIFQRYHAMLGHKLRWQNGFDCHGLWIEVEVEKEGNWQSKSAIHDNMAHFITCCEDRTHRFTQIITEQSISLGQWNHWNNSYRTDSTKNIEHIWHFLHTCHKKGLLYHDFQVMPWCTRCGTSLSHHEMADCYKDKKDSSVYFKLPLINNQANLLVWTTTPWTVPANTALAVHPDMTYVAICHPEHGYLWMSANAHQRLFPNNPVHMRSAGKNFISLKYQPFFKIQDVNKYKIIPWDKINPEEGSGIVHIAPGCGADDFLLSQKHAISTVVPVQENGVFYEDFGTYANLLWQTVNKCVIIHMEQSKHLVLKEEYTHRYPHCWRCQEPLIFRKCHEWFLAATKIREQLIDAAKTVKWVPEYIEYHMLNWLENMNDWCISRRRFWGLPLPFYPCTHCKQTTVVDSIGTLRKLAVDVGELDTLPHFHRPWIDKITIKCPLCNHKPLTRVAAVGDCWLDAGIVPFSTTNYLTKGINKEYFPFALVSEMKEQVRLWFYSTLLTSVVLTDKAPYQVVHTYDEMRNKKGEKFSKTKGNAPVLDDLVGTYGADSVRLALAAAPTNAPYLYNEETIKLAQRKIHTLWNCYSYFAQAANRDKPTLKYPSYDELNDSLDRWIFAKLSALSDKIHQSLQQFQTNTVVTSFYEFVDDLSSWYVRLKRPVFMGNDLNKKASSYNALYGVLSDLACLMAPVLPFTSESIWKRFRKVCGHAGNKESVHLCKIPQLGGNWGEILEKMEVAMEIVQEVHKLRNIAKQKVRQPLEAMYVTNLDWKYLPPDIVSLVLQETNVHKIYYVSDVVEEAGYVHVETARRKVALNVMVTDELKDQGNLREVVRCIQDLRKKAGLLAGVNKGLAYFCDDMAAEWLEKHKEYLERHTSCQLCRVDLFKFRFESRLELNNYVFDLGMS